MYYKNNLNIKNFYKILKRPIFNRTSFLIRDFPEGRILLEKKTGALLTKKIYYNKKNYYKNNKEFNPGVDNFVKNNLQDFLKKNKFNNVCDFGCGFGNYSEIVKKYSKNYYGIEINKKKILSLKRKKINYRNSLKEFNIDFDLIFFIFSFNHLENQLEILNEVKQKLSLKGKIFMILLNANDLIFKKNFIESYNNFRISKEFVVMHTEKSIRAFLKFKKFKKIKVKFEQRYGFENLLKWLFNKDIELFNKIKKNNLKKINTDYKNYRKQQKSTDTIIVEACNN
jgi:2-polyprenyl-3-methyl-5-hydroxy-6-metoxy-1,4-benzoquinol methylase